MTALDISLSLPAQLRVGGVCALSGAPIVVEQWAKRLRVHPGLPVLVTHGTADMVRSHSPAVHSSVPGKYPTRKPGDVSPGFPEMYTLSRTQWDIHAILVAAAPIIPVSRPSFPRVPPDMRSIHPHARH